MIQERAIHISSISRENAKVTKPEDFEITFTPHIQLTTASISEVPLT